MSRTIAFVGRNLRFWRDFKVFGRKWRFEDKGDFLTFHAVNPLFSLDFSGFVLTFIDVYNFSRLLLTLVDFT